MRESSSKGYDIIGDVHGHLELLTALLEKLGYRPVHGTWRHEGGRTAVFVGDIIDRGPFQVDTVRVVRDMVEEGSACCVLGNHEYNALCYALGLRDLRASDPHHTFLSEAPKGSAVYKECISWFLRLPVWLDFSDFSVVHACWDPLSVNRLLEAGVTDDHLLDKDFYHFAVRGEFAPEGSQENLAYHALDTLLKGREIALPPPYTFTDNDGRERTRMRIRWWDGEAKTYAALALQPGVRDIPNIPLREPVRTTPPAKPLFMGHYWLTPTEIPAPLSSSIVCVDYSAGHGGPLVAYRWSEEDGRRLTGGHFVLADAFTG
ncbi:MAG: metallophosphoesterase [Desulfovibrio sp.]|nr:metallophosphoesterase [Desulfovibrio sp.]